MRRWIIAAALGVGTLYSPTASSTIATHRNEVAGCVIAGQFVPYAGQRRAAVKLPYWVRKPGGGNLEGQEIRLIWSARVTDREIPNYVFERNAARWEVVGTYDRSRLPAPGDGST